MRDDDGFMRRWEYCHVFVGFGAETQKVVRYQVTGPAYTDVRKDEAYGDTDATDAAYRLVAQLGLDGWEMVGASDANQFGQQRLYVFKRPMP